MVTPVFQITDYSQSIAYYIGWLGFSLDWEERGPGPGHYLQVSRGSIVLHLTTRPHESCVGARAMAEFNGLPAFHRLLGQRESAFAVPVPHKAPWNDKVTLLELVDPAGNCLVLAEVCG